MFRHDSVVFLIGAGCSAEAGISVSSKMRQDLERLLCGNSDWQQFSELYNYVKGAIIQHDCSNGRGCLEPDIERLVITLNELERHQESLLYPFIGSWCPRLQTLTRHDFEIVKRFRREILKQLKAWVMPPNYIRDSSYYGGFFRFQEDYSYALRVFSLNYDLCLEKNAPENRTVMRGFDSDSRIWNSALFDAEDESSRIYLYKLHGSINWQRDLPDGRVREVDYSDSPELIFGTESKMQSNDPYLFYTYEFRRWCLEARLIITIGYSFRDKHITDIIRQSLQFKSNQKLLIVSGHPEVAQEILSLGKQVIPHKETAKLFLDTLTIKRLMELASFTEKDLLETDLFRSEATV